VIALVVVAVLGGPLLLLARHQVWTSARTELRQQAQTVAAGLEDRLDAGKSVHLTPFASLVRDRRVIVVASDGTRTVGGADVAGAVLRSSVGVSRSVVTVERSEGGVADRAQAVSLLVIGAALAAVALAVGLAVVQARRLSAPLAALAARAHSMGQGNFDPEPIRSGIAEIDAISQVLVRRARQVSAMIELNRHFASDAAHQLRTPLTGIGLRLEELAETGSPAARQEAEGALTQVERLDRVITTLLARAREDLSEPVRVDLGELVEHETDPWRVALAEQGRTLALDVQTPLAVRARREHLATILHCLLENALQHGAGAVRVTARRSDSTVQVTVGDSGPGVAPDLAMHIFDRRFSGSSGTGIGLALARSLAAAEDGRLELRASGDSDFVLTLTAERET
jgi:signal transduction histidine kinase